MTITTALMAASTAVSAIGASSSAKAQQAQLTYQSQVAANNAAIAEDNRKRAIQEASVAAADKDQSASEALGQIVAQAGASGLNLATGSKAAKVSSARKLSKRDRSRIINDGAIEGGRFAQQGANFKNRSTNLLTARSNAGRAGKFAVASTLISGAAQTSRYYNSLK